MGMSRSNFSKTGIVGPPLERSLRQSVFRTNRAAANRPVCLDTFTLISQNSGSVSHAGCLRNCPKRVVTGCALIFALAGLSACTKRPTCDEIVKQSFPLVEGQSKGAQLFGWSAIGTCFVTDSSLAPLDPHELGTLESLAIKTDTPEAVKALSAIYARVPELRDTALRDAVQGVPVVARLKNRFYAAALSFLVPPPSDPNANFWGKWTQRFRKQRTPLPLPDATKLKSDLTTQLAGSSSAMDEKNLLDKIVSVPDLAHYVSALLLLQDNLSGSAGSDLRMRELLSHCGATQFEESYGKLISQGCTRTYVALLRPKQVARARANSVFNWKLRAVEADASLEDRGLAVAPTDDSSISIDGRILTPRPFNDPNAARQAGAKQLLGISGYIHCWGGGSGSLEFYDNRGHGTNKGSACFTSFTDSTMVPDLPVTVLQFGVQYYTWVMPGGSGNAKYSIRLGFRASPETNWLIVRFQPEAGAPSSDAIVCDDGCGARTPNGVEPDTKWALFRVEQGKTLQLVGTFPSKIDLKGPNSFGLPYRDRIQVAELNKNASGQFDAVDPLQIVKITQRNPILSYAAGLQASLVKGAWLAPTGDVVQSSAFANARLQLLAHLAQMPDSEIQKPLLPPLLDTSTDQYAHCRWKERKAFLANAIPTLQSRLSDTYEGPLGEQVSFIYGFLPQIVTARTNLTKALESLNKLSDRDVKNSLSSASKVTGTNDDAPIVVHSSLAAAVFGAQEAVASVEQLLTTNVVLACSTLSTYPSANADVKVAAVANICQQNQ
jgi:hypothetical protein